MGDEIGATGAWSAAAAEVVQAGGVDRVVMNYARGFREPDLEFLAGLPIHGLFILSYTPRVLEPMYSLGDALTDQCTSLCSPRSCVTSALTTRYIASPLPPQLTYSRDAKPDTPGCRSSRRCAVA